MDELSKHAKRITDPVFDVSGDRSLTAGQTLTVLRMAREVIDTEMARWQEAIEDRTAIEEQTGKKDD